MRYHVRGASKSTGDDQSVWVHAANAAEAREQALKAGLFISSVEAVAPPERRVAAVATVLFRVLVLAALGWCGRSLHAITSEGVRVSEAVAVGNWPLQQTVRVSGKVDVNWPRSLDVSLDNWYELQGLTVDVDIR